MGGKVSIHSSDTFYTALPFWKVNPGLKVLLEVQFGHISSACKNKEKVHKSKKEQTCTLTDTHPQTNWIKQKEYFTLFFVDMWCNSYLNIADLVDVLYVVLRPSVSCCVFSLCLPVNRLVPVKLLYNYSIFALDCREVETLLKIIKY